MQKKIKKIGVFLRPQTPKEVFLDIKQAFEKSSIEVLLGKSQIAEIDFAPSYTFEEIISKVDAIASVGGDGTLLSLIRKSYGNSIPIFGINTGKLGFLTAINPFEVENFANSLARGTYILEEHMMLEAQINHQKFFAINEFLISKNNLVSGILKIDAYMNNEIFNTYKGDSLIIATPTGSTAYNISAGGSIVYPLCQNILLTPVAAHTLTQRPMVLDSTFILNFKLNTQGFLVIDGQENILVESKDTIIIQKAQKSAILIQPFKRNYFKVLKEKFQWGQND
ncbi:MULTISPECIES: NAD(+)/NADH kinase [unclassified Helicobacter]|uniref:NAD(+)/NADH kinase n=1 Tax=unclassified Helicobacter TaxID=2593540 RepID=UPI000CF1A076|nr:MULTISPECIES: NAD(+)/NADH kinase [unclassified Helicobacter]